VIGKSEDFFDNFRGGRNARRRECRFDVVRRGSGEDFADCTGCGGNIRCVQVGWELVDLKKWFHGWGWG
jgi:hypothetical protein